jgi:hypothetical protein
LTDLPDAVGLKLVDIEIRLRLSVEAETRLFKLGICLSYDNPSSAHLSDLFYRGIQTTLCSSGEMLSFVREKSGGFLKHPSTMAALGDSLTVDLRGSELRR